MSNDTTPDRRQAAEIGGRFLAEDVLRLDPDGADLAFAAGYLAAKAEKDNAHAKQHAEDGARAFKRDREERAKR